MLMSQINGVHKIERVMMTDTAKIAASASDNANMEHRLLNTACKTDKSFLQMAQSNLKPINLLNKAFYFARNCDCVCFIPYIIFK